jgi:hypothetical protein
VGVRSCRRFTCGMAVDHDAFDHMVEEPEVECDAMGNPVIHTIVFIVAVVIPGGLIAYFGWRAYRTRRDRLAAKTKVREAQEAFRKQFPLQSESLRVRSRRNRLYTYKRRPRNKSPE